MATPYRTMLRKWGDAAEFSPVMIEIRFNEVGGERHAYHEARKLVVGFASLRQWTRKKHDRGQEVMNQPYFKQTQYENIVCYLRKNVESYTVFFVSEDDPGFTNVYHDVSVQPLVKESKKETVAQMMGIEFEPIPQPKYVRDTELSVDDIDD